MKTENPGQIVYLPIDTLHPHLANPRKDLGDLTELAASIKTKGVLQNLTVVPYYSQVHKREMDGLYTIIIGHRRHAAAKLAGLKELPCIITHMTDEEQIDTMAIENLQRSDLTAYEQGEHFQMMLDMGGRTVQQVAEKTGFSESTIRSRLKLPKLDKKKFQEAEARGGTMADYLKVAAIENDDRRNEVLGAIGTSDFNLRYREAMRAEANDKYLQDTIDAFRHADWCEEITEEQRDELDGKFIRYVHNYQHHNKRPVEKPEDAGDGLSQEQYLYFFFVGREQVDLYKQIKVKERSELQTAETEASEPVAAAPEISPEEQERRQTADQITALLTECQDQEDDFQTMRETFIREFSAFTTYREEIMAFHMKAWMFVDGRRYTEMLDKERLAQMLGIGYDEDKDELDKAALDQRLRVLPEEVLLYTAYILLEDGSRKWLTTLYDNTVKCSLPKYRQDKQLDLLYECLRTLGYAWSTAEQKASVGDLPQFREAERLVKEYNGGAAK